VPDGGQGDQQLRKGSSARLKPNVQGEHPTDAVNGEIYFHIACRIGGIDRVGDGLRRNCMQHIEPRLVLNSLILPGLC